MFKIVECPLCGGSGDVTETVVPKYLQMKADAALGQAVRKLRDGWRLWPQEYYTVDATRPIVVRWRVATWNDVYSGDTPEEAIRAALAAEAQPCAHAVQEAGDE